MYGCARVRQRMMYRERESERRERERETLKKGEVNENPLLVSASKDFFLSIAHINYFHYCVESFFSTLMVCKSLFSFFF